MRMEARQAVNAGSGAQRVRRPRPDHPEDFGRGPWWRLAELFFLGVILPSPPPAPRIRIEDDEELADQPA
jgi:hypothetical protein